MEIVSEGSSVLDLGRGELLAALVKERAVRGQGIEEIALYPRSCLPVIVSMSIFTTAVMAIFASGN